MKDVNTGQTYLTKRTKEVAGPRFAKSGYNVESLKDTREILSAWVNTLTDDEVTALLEHLKRPKSTP
jgi:hypothetical protein